jgi:hypothetical protein
MDSKLRGRYCEERFFKSFQKLSKLICMRSRHSFSTDFIIRKCKGDKSKAILFARITVDGCSKEISIKEKIDSDDWDNKREMVKGKSQAAKAINNAIDDIRFRIKEKYRMLEDAGAHKAQGIYQLHLF